MIASTARRASAAFLLALTTVLVLAAPATAAPQPAVVVWAGNLSPGTPLRGVILKASGNGQRLEVRVADRSTGKVTTAGAFAPTPAQRTAIRAAAKAAMGAPTITSARSGEHGGYASATIQSGAKTKTVLGLNATPPQLAALLVAVNRALPPDARLRDPATGFAKIAAGPSTAGCPPGRTPTTISKRISLADAASKGIVNLTGKGGYGGDVVAVDAVFKPVIAPVTVQINLEVSTYPGGPSAAAVKSAIEGNLKGRVASNGTPVNFDVNVLARAPGAYPTPCFHQVEMLKDSEYRGQAADPDVDPLTTPGTGQWPSGRGPVGDRQNWTHEALHLTGLEDRYGSVFVAKGGKVYPVPDTVDIVDKAAVAEWAKSQGLNAKSGVSGTKAKPGYENDIMGDVFKGTEKLNQKDVNAFAAIGTNRLTIKSAPGDVLVNKDGGAQNLGVGAPFELTVEPGKPGRVNGMVAYCLDAGRRYPDPGLTYDVLGPAGEQPEAAMQYLQRVLEVVGRRSIADPLGSVVGAQSAVWRVTDDSSPTSEEAQAILVEAGVPPDATFAAPHFDNPNAGGAWTAAVTPTGVKPSTAPPGPPPTTDLVPRPAPRLIALSLSTRKFKASRRRTITTATVTLDGAPGAVQLTLQRRGKRGKLKTLTTQPPERLSEGPTLVSVLLPRLSPGSYQLVATGPFTPRAARFTVRR